jgi:spore maturation protein SpmA
MKQLGLLTLKVERLGILAIREEAGLVTLYAVTCCTVTARLSLVPAMPKLAAEQPTARDSSDTAWPESIFS